MGRCEAESSRLCSSAACRLRAKAEGERAGVPNPAKWRVYCRNEVENEGEVQSTADHQPAAPKGKLLQKALAKLKLAGAEVGKTSTQTCGAFVAEQANFDLTRTCPRCKHLVCGRCGTGRKHKHPDEECCYEVDEADEAGQPSKDYKGQTRGRDYQLCPNRLCGLPIYLGDGCNHMTCPSAACKTQFCFICGQKAAHDSGHWGSGMPCPRFHRPGAANAIHDGDPEEEEDENTQQRLGIHPRDLTPRQQVWLMDPEERNHLPVGILLVLEDLFNFHGRQHVQAVQNGIEYRIHNLAASVFFVLRTLFSPAFRQPLLTGDVAQLQANLDWAVNETQKVELALTLHALEADVHIPEDSALQDRINRLRAEHATFVAISEAALAQAIDPEEVDERQRSWTFEPGEHYQLPINLLALLRDLRTAHGHHHIRAVYTGAPELLHNLAAGAFLALRHYFSPPSQQALTAGDRAELDARVDWALATMAGMEEALTLYAQADVHIAEGSVLQSAIERLRAEHAISMDRARVAFEEIEAAEAAADDGWSTEMNPDDNEGNGDEMNPGDDGGNGDEMNLGDDEGQGGRGE